MPELFFQKRAGLCSEERVISWLIYLCQDFEATKQLFLLISSSVTLIKTLRVGY